MKISFTINGQEQSVEIADKNTPLLWVVRDILNLKGTKFGCGKAACGACTLHVDGEAVRSCSCAVKFAEGKNIRTIEGLGTKEAPHPVQQAWMEYVVPQCGYCQSGMIMAAESLLDNIPTPTDEDINTAMTNICRCGTYQRARAAIHTAAKLRANDAELLG